MSILWFHSSKLGHFQTMRQNGKNLIVYWSVCVIASLKFEPDSKFRIENSSRIRKQSYWLWMQIYWTHLHILSANFWNPNSMKPFLNPISEFKKKKKESKEFFQIWMQMFLNSYANLFEFESQFFIDIIELMLISPMFSWKYR